MSPIPEHGRLLGVDVGTVRIGLAVCDADRVLASPLHTYKRRGPSHDAFFFQNLCQREAIVGIIVGLPITLREEEGPKARECRAFGRWLQQITALPLEFQDERFTTALADDTLRAAGLTHKRRKMRLDMLAAQQILQNWLDASRLDRT